MADGAELSHVRAVVTGATSGLGAAMAAALADAGARVAYAARPTSRLNEAVAAALAVGRHAVALPVDVRDPGSVDAAAALATERLGGVDLVVNNAGIGMRTVNPRFFEQSQPFFEVPVEGFTDVVATNLTGYFLVGRAFAPLLIESQGRLVNVSMNHSTMHRKGFVPYGPSRAGAEALSHIMAGDLEEFGVTVNLLLPGGATATGMVPEGPTHEARAGLLDPAIMGPPVVWLATPAAAGVTDQRIVATEWEEWLAARASG